MNIKKESLFFCFISFATLFYAQINEQIDTSYSDWSEDMDGNDYFRDELFSIGIKYQYDAESQTHNYSGNFDFDGDFLTDSLYLLGNDGAHLLYSPEIILSSTKKRYALTDITIDDPEFHPISTLQQLSFLEFLPPRFVIGTYKELLGEEDFSLLNRHVLFFHLDKIDLPEELKKQGVTSENIVIYFFDNEFKIQNFR